MFIYKSRVQLIFYNNNKIVHRQMGVMNFILIILLQIKNTVTGFIIKGYRHATWEFLNAFIRSKLMMLSENTVTAKVIISGLQIVAPQHSRSLSKEAGKPGMWSQDDGTHR